MMSSATTISSTSFVAARLAPTPSNVAFFLGDSSKFDDGGDFDLDSLISTKLVFLVISGIDGFCNNAVVAVGGEKLRETLLGNSDLSNNDPPPFGGVAGTEAAADPLTIAASDVAGINDGGMGAGYDLPTGRDFDKFDESDLGAGAMRYRERKVDVLIE